MKLDSRPLGWILAGFASVELLLLLALCFLGDAAFLSFVWWDDSGEYHRAALELAGGSLPRTPRTLGYPLFLALAHLLAGPDRGIQLAIALQLLLNLGLTAGCWNLLERLAPEAGAGFRAALTVFLGVAGLGMAVCVLSDFLAAFCFAVFLYGLLFWHTRGLLAFAGAGLALATLVRPTFTLVAVLVPVLASVVRFCTRPLPLRHALALILWSVGATGASLAYQYGVNGYVGPSAIVTQNLQRVLFFTRDDESVSIEAHVEAFEAEVARRAERPFDDLSWSEQEAYARELLAEHARTHSGAIVALAATSFVKYVFAPVETLVARLTGAVASEELYGRYFRPAIALFCMPVWVLALVPPRGPTARRAFYLLALLLLAYLAGITALNPQQGERVRFPVLAFLPIVAWNGHAVANFVRSRWLPSKVEPG